MGGEDLRAGRQHSALISVRADLVTPDDEAPTVAVEAKWLYGKGPFDSADLRFSGGAEFRFAGRSVRPELGTRLELRNGGALYFDIGMDLPLEDPATRGALIGGGVAVYLTRNVGFGVDVTYVDRRDPAPSALTEGLFAFFRY